MAADLGIPDLTDVEEIGAGGNGVVYRARQVELDRMVAVKMVHLANNPETIERFNRECRTMARIAIHPGIAPIFASGTSATGKPYLIMPYYEAGSLADRMASGPMAWAEAARIMVSVADAVQHAHEIDVIHRDLKPDNIMIDGRGEPVVVDFGIAKLVGADSQSVGIHLTPSYAPPEAFDGKLPDSRYDVYSLGATLHAVIAGRLPFPTEGGILAVGMQKATKPPPDLRAYAPDAVCRCMEQAMAIDPTVRYQTAAQFGQALAAAAGVGAPAAAADSVQDFKATQLAPQTPAVPVDYSAPSDQTIASPSQQPVGYQAPTSPPQQPPQVQAPTPPPQPQQFQAPTPPPHQPQQFQAPTPAPQQPQQFHTPTPPPQQPQQFHTPTPPPQQPQQFHTPTPPPQQPHGYQAPSQQGAPYQNSQPGLYGVNSVSANTAGSTQKNSPSNGVLIAVLAAVAVVILGGLGALFAFRDSGDTIASEPPDSPEITSPSGNETGGTDTTEDTTDTSIDESAAVAPEDDRTSGDVTAKELEVGDCFTLPTTGGIFDTVALNSCDVAHDAEVVAVLEHPDAGGDYPGIDDLSEYSLFPCADAFQRYTGAEDEFFTELQSGTLFPTFDEWQDGIFVLPCIASRWDGSPLTFSVRDAADEPSVNLDFGDLNGLDRLLIGDCFKEVDGDIETTPVRQTVELVDCADVNDGEVIGYIDLAGPEGGSYDFDFLLEESLTGCTPTYIDYTGDDVIDGSGLNGIVPSAFEWSSSVNYGICIVLKFQGGEPGSVAGF